VRTGLVTALTAAIVSLPATASAQTDYYNTDAGRPIQVEDANAIERRAIEIQLAPLRLERARGGSYTWGVEPEIAVGLLPRTQFEIGFPLAYRDAPRGEDVGGLAGIGISILHALNTETAIPALAIAADLLLPIGGLAPDRAYPSVKGIVTKTLSWARFHFNGRYTFGEEPDEAGEVAHGELSRWMAGLAIDRAIPLRSLLLTAEIVTQQPLADTRTRAWDAASGFRYQIGPRVALDGGGGYRFSGNAEGWFITFGAATAFGLPWSQK